MLELKYLEGAKAGERIQVNFETAWFGRQPTCDFVLQGEGISRVHFSIVKRGQNYVLIDNKSTNGTFVNKLRTNAVTLKPGYIIAAGSCLMEVCESVADAAVGAFRFVVEEVGELAGEKRNAQVFEQTSVLIGRKTICHVQLNEPDVWPVHAELSVDAEGVWISDRSAGAGVHVNGQRVLKEKLSDRATIHIKPFDIAVELKPGLCILRVQRSYLGTAAFRAAAPGAEPATAPAKSVRPTDFIAALPEWQQEKAPVYLPSSDILPNKLRSAAVWGALVLAAAGTGFAWMFSRNFFVPGPVTKAHADLASDCATCHTSNFQRVQDASCQTCHADFAPSMTHAAAEVKCWTCHAEHQGVDYKFTAALGKTCQSAACHTTVHVKQKAALADVNAVTAAFEARFLGGDNKGVFALANNELKVTTAPADNAMHKLHAEKGAACEMCHAAEDKSPRNQVLDTQYKVTEPGVEKKVRRERCMLCHGFGPDETLQARCMGCHFEHPADAEKNAIFIKPALAATAPTGIPKPPGGLVYLLGSLALFPVLYFAGTTVGLLRNGAKAKARAIVEAKAARAAAPAQTPAETEPKPPVKQAHLRPQIDLDLCVGCAACVHACPFNVLEIVDEKAIAVRMDDCTGYAACAAECPTEAIVLVDTGANRKMELPTYDEALETNVPGLYLAGEVTGKALIKVAINQGRAVVDSILKNRPTPGDLYDLIVVGAGPAGTSAALAAKEARLKVLVLEQGTTANTISSYPRQKFVMAEPVMIPLVGPLWMEDSSKENLLEKWKEIIAKTGLVVNEGEKVSGVKREADGTFAVKSTNGEYRGSRVVIAIGRRGSPRRLGVPGEDLPKVAYSLVDAEAYQGKQICIVGGGDSGIEAANGLARADLNNKVVIIHRSESFSAAKARNQKKIKKNIDAGRIVVSFNSAVTEVRENSILVKTPNGPFEVPNDFLFVMVGGENPKKFLSQCGIEFTERALV